MTFSQRLMSYVLCLNVSTTPLAHHLPYSIYKLLNGLVKLFFLKCKFKVKQKYWFCLYKGSENASFPNIFCYSADPSIAKLSLVLASIERIKSFFCDTTFKIVFNLVFFTNPLLGDLLNVFPVY